MSAPPAAEVVSSTSLDVSDAERLADKITRTPNLYRLSLRNSNLSKAALRLVLSALPSTPGLQVLDLGGSNLTCSCASLVADALLHVPNLRSLILSNNFTRFDDDHDASGPDPDGAGVVLAPALRRVPSLQHLDLANTSFEDKSACAVAESLPFLPKLQHLGLGGHLFGARGATALAAALACVPDLRVLVVSAFLDESGFGEEGAVAFSRNLCYTPRLRTLSMSGNSLGVTGLRHLVDALPQCPDLRTLGLCDSFYEDPDGEGGRALSTVLEHCPKLEEFDLSMTVIGDAGASLLATALHKHGSNLNRLDVSYCGISPAGATILAAAKRVFALNALQILSESEASTPPLVEAELFLHQAGVPLFRDRLLLLLVGARVGAPGGGSNSLQRFCESDIFDTNVLAELWSLLSGEPSRHVVRGSNSSSSPSARPRKSVRLQ